MLLYAKMFQSEAITHILQPFAITHSTYLENKLAIRADRRMLLQKLIAIDHEITLRNQYTWRCPVHVLESKVQISSKGLPKWKTRARIGVYLGRSSVYIGNVAMVLNLSSSYVSLQYHIVFDDDFSLILSLRTNMVPSNQADLVARSTESITSDNIEPSKLYFKQNYIDPNELDIGFRVIFNVPSTQQSSQHRPNTSDEPKSNSLPLSLDSEGDITPIPVPASEEDIQPYPVSPAYKRGTASVNSEEEQGTRSRKIRVRFKDTESSMLNIID